MKALFVSGAAIAALLAMGAAGAQAAPVSPIDLGLYNTGVDNSGNTLTNGTVDSHWSLSCSGPCAPGTAYAATSVGGFPIGPWIGDNTTSTWLAPTTPANGSSGYDPTTDGAYNWTLHFTLGSTLGVGFTAQLAADNKPTSITLNGNPIPVPGPTGSNTNGPPPEYFHSWEIFQALTGFVSGDNTLTITVLNYHQDGGNPTGFRLEFTDASQAGAPVPLPAAVWLFGTALAGTGFLARRRRNKQAPAV